MGLVGRGSGDTADGPLPERLGSPDDLAHEEMLLARDQFYSRRGAQAIPPCEKCQFAGSLYKAKLLPSGGMELVIHVPMSEKYNAMTLTDAVGIVVSFAAQRRRRSQARMMLVKNLTNEQEGSDYGD